MHHKKKKPWRDSRTLVKWKRWEHWWLNGKVEMRAEEPEVVHELAKSGDVWQNLIEIH